MQGSCTVFQVSIEYVHSVELVLAMEALDFHGKSMVRSLICTVCKSCLPTVGKLFDRLSLLRNTMTREFIPTVLEDRCFIF